MKIRFVGATATYNSGTGREPLLSRVPMNLTRSSCFVLLAIALLSTSSILQGAGAIVFVKTGNVWIMNTDGTGQRPLTAQGGASQPRIANGAIVFIRNGQLYKTDSGGSTPQAIANTSTVRELALHPNGSKIAIAYDSNFVLYTMNINGTGRTAINSTSNLHQIYPYWGRDGYIYLGQAPSGNPFAQSVYRIPENGVNNPTSLVSYFSQQPAEGGTQGKIAFLYNQPAPRLRLSNRDGSGQSDVPNSPSGINEMAFDYESNVIYYSMSDQIRRISTTGSGDALLASGTNGDFGYGTVAAAGVCYIDFACSGGSQYSVRDSGSGQCVAQASCTQLWKCASGPTTGTCGGGTTDCAFSPGCQSGAQTCSDGFCTDISSCNDRIKFQATGPEACPNTPCTQDATTLCLNNGRFKVQVNWAANNQSGSGTAVNMTNDTGHFWFFNSANVELVVKALDGRPVNGKWWIFYGALSNVFYSMTVTDTQTGAVRTYINPPGTFASRGDTDAFNP